MDNFFQIDWNPPLQDIIDTKFVDSDRFKRESVVYRMLHDRFNDPFYDIYEEQDHMVTSEMMAQVALEAGKQKQKQKQKAETKTETVTKAESVQESTVQKLQPQRKHYVPGITASSVWFPRTSNLSTQQQALCLKVLLKFYGSERPEITAKDKEDLQTYMSLQSTISKEQDEYLEIAKNNWDASKFTIHEEQFINAQWKRKIKRVESLPRYYMESGNLPFVSPKEIGLNFHSTCLAMGMVPITMLPTLTQRFILTTSATKINQRFFSAETNGGNQKNVIFKTPVSQDANCDILAKDHDVDLVISSSGLNCLALNIDPQNTTSWILPIVVKRINERNVVYIDKPLPPTGLTVIQKNAWIFKYKIKAYVHHPYHKNVIGLDAQGVEEKDQFRLSRYIDSVAEEKVSEGTGEDNTEEACGNKNASKMGDQNCRFLRPPAGHNLIYRLFSVGSCGEHQSELLKNRVEKAYKLLVRSKADGAIVESNGDSQLMLIASKLEHQLDLGAAAVTAEEAAKQWMTLTFRPDTTLARVRIDATTSEVIQIETRTAISVNNEIKRLYKLKTETALTLLYNVAETMTNMMPGRYLMRHTVRSGGFANIYKEVDGPGKNVFDLQAVYCEDEFRTIPNPPWPAIDKTVITPAIKCFNRMPAMFRPKNKVAKVEIKKKKKTWKKKKKNANATNAANADNADNADGVRKSLRKKGAQ